MGSTCWALSFRLLINTSAAFASKGATKQMWFSHLPSCGKSGVGCHLLPSCGADMETLCTSLVLPRLAQVPKGKHLAVPVQLQDRTCLPGALNSGSFIVVLEQGLKQREWIMTFTPSFEVCSGIWILTVIREAFLVILFSLSHYFILMYQFRKE